MDLTPELADASKKAESTGAKIGGAVGIVAGAAAAPVAGPVVAIALVVGTVLRGSEIAGVVQFIGAGTAVSYPPQVVLRVGPGGSR